MAFENIANAELRKLNIPLSAHEQATAVTSKLALHYEGQSFLWGVSEQEQSFFPLNVGLPPQWGGMTMKHLYLVKLSVEGYQVRKISQEEAVRLIQYKPALPITDKAKLVTQVTRILSMTCWGVIQDPPYPKDTPYYWPDWLEYFKSNNQLMELFMTEALNHLNA